MRLARPEIGEMGSVILRLSQVPPGTYALETDGAECGEVSEEQLARGLSIAGLSPVAVEKARALAALLDQRGQVARFAWRTLEAGSGMDQKKATPRALEALRDLVEEMTDQARALARPHSYSVRLRLVGPPRRRVTPLAAAVP